MGSPVILRVSYYDWGKFDIFQILSTAVEPSILVIVAAVSVVVGVILLLAIIAAALINISLLFRKRETSKDSDEKTTETNMYEI